MLMRDASLKQRIPCIMRISIFGAFSVGKKCALYTGKYGRLFCMVVSHIKQDNQIFDVIINETDWQFM